MLKISPISGAAEGRYKLVIVTAFKLSGTGDDCYIPTPKVYAHEYESSLWTAYFDGTHGSSTELYYYVNIDDDTRIQSNNLDFTIQLWRVDRYYYVLGVKCKKWDKKLVGGIDTYHINNIGHSEILNSTKYDDSIKIYEAKVKVETIGVEKANSIAIYDTNSTIFNGHYQEQERMNVIQLYVNDSGSGTPFEEGLNTIVIPTSLFTETLFNAHVQNETLNETTIYSSDEDIFKFISVGRDGNTQQACEEIDFIIIRFDISSEDAMEVLNLLLECLVNETTNETAIVYGYVSTKENGTAAVMMNLPFSVLGLIPWYCDFENSPMGSKPETFGDWFWKPLKTLGKAIVGFFITIGMAITDLIILIIDFVAEILLDILPIFAYILWLIIRVIILILVWIMFIIMLFLTIILFISLIALVYVLDIFLDLNINTSLNKISIDGDVDLSTGYYIGFTYNSFFCLIIPSIEMYFDSSNFHLGYSQNWFSTDVNFSDYPENFLYNITHSGPEQSSNNPPKMSSDTSVGNFIIDMFIGAGIGMGISGGVVGTICSILTYSKDPGWAKAITIASFIIFVTSVILLISNLEFSSGTLIGMGLGFIGAGIYFIKTCSHLENDSQPVSTFMKKFGLVKWSGVQRYWKVAKYIFGFFMAFDIILGTAGLCLDFEDYIKGESDEIAEHDLLSTLISLGSGFTSLLLAKYAIMYLGGHYEGAKSQPSGNKMGFKIEDKSTAALLFGVGSLFIGLKILELGCALLEE